ncbi:MAG: hypothetical protein N838_09010 [Thiohalocapsa sp. PB-PSB1]|jgi:uncharacterized protein YukE|nr:MAG: hypothetical protein N838_09010 [Thiohalocapsa sp. PB-PSB1]
MASYALKQETDELREYMKELSYQAMRTDMAVNRLSGEMREFKDEMRGFKDEMLEFKDEMRGFKDEMLEFKDEMRGFKDEMRGFKDEMLEFKDEMRGFKDEMREFKDEMSEFKDEMRGFKDEMSEFKDEMREFKDETRRESQRMNKQWGDLANRLGTLVEDIVAPSLPRLAAEYFDCDILELFALRVVRRKGGETREYDAMLVCPGLVLINETKSRLQATQVEELLQTLAEFPRFYPEYQDRRIIGVLASLYPEDGIVTHATRKGVLVMGMGDEAMQLLNPDALHSASS